MRSSALSFTAAIWPACVLMCGILHTGTGIPLSDFYPFGENENDFTVGPTLDGSNSTMLDQEFPFFDEMYDLIHVSIINRQLVECNEVYVVHQKQHLGVLHTKWRTMNIVIKYDSQT